MKGRVISIVILVTAAATWAEPPSSKATAAIALATSSRAVAASTDTFEARFRSFWSTTAISFKSTARTGLTIFVR